MYRLFVEQHFDSAHFLRGYQGKCEAVHGHRFNAVLKVKAEKLNDIGITCDFTDLKQYLREVVSRFDHSLLNDLKPFDEINPSSENIAVTIYNELKPRLTEANVTIESVEVWETPQQGVSYFPE